MTRIGPILAAALLLAPAARASAETAIAPGVASPFGESVSYSIWTIDGATVRMRFLLPTSQAAGLVAPREVLPNRKAIAGVVATTLSVTSAGGECPPIVQGEGVGTIYTLSLTPGLDRFEMIFACPSTAGIVLHDRLLFDRVPGHLNYARVQGGGGQPMLRLFTRDSRSIAVSATGRTELAAFAGRGALTLITTVELLLFVAGLLMLCRRWPDVGLAGGGLVAGNIVGMLLAAQGLVTARPASVGPRRRRAASRYRRRRCRLATFPR